MGDFYLYFLKGESVDVARVVGTEFQTAAAATTIFIINMLSVENKNNKKNPIYNLHTNEHNNRNL